MENILSVGLEGRETKSIKLSAELTKLGETTSEHPPT